MNQLNKSLQSTAGLITIIENSAPFERMELQFVPQSLNNSRTAKIGTINSVGSNSDKLHLLGGTESVSFKASFFSIEMDLENVVEKMNWLKSLTMQPKRNIILSWANMYDDFLFTVSSVNSNLSDFRLEQDLRPRKLEVDVVLKVDYSEDFTLENLRNNGR